MIRYFLLIGILIVLWACLALFEPKTITHYQPPKVKQPTIEAPTKKLPPKRDRAKKPKEEWWDLDIPW